MVFDTWMEIILINIVIILVLLLIGCIIKYKYESVESISEKISDEKVVLLERELKIRRMCMVIGPGLEYEIAKMYVDEEYAYYLRLLQKRLE